jgi:methyl-accepting chemotaxis protein
MNLRLSHKIPLAIAATTLITASAIGYLSINAMTQISEAGIAENMSAKLYSKKVAVNGLMADIVGDLHAIADSPFVIDAMKDFAGAYAELGDDPVTYLQTKYITENPNETGKKDMLDSANDGSRYSEIHAKNHPYLHEFLQENGYYDVFLIDVQGNIVYTVFKELDYATNLKTGEWKDTDIAKLYTKIMATPDAETTSFIDYAPYAPSADVPAAFIGRPIEDTEGHYIGALIFQMPIDKFSKIFNDEFGMGNTGRILLVGQDKMLRNNVRFAKEPTILKVKADNPEVEEALNKKDGVNLNAKNENGEDVITAYSNYSFDSANYALLFEMDKDEVLAPVIAERNQFFMIAAGIIIALSMMGYLFSRGITNSISGITRAMRKVADGDLQTEVPGLSRKDEVGEMASALQVFKENAAAIEQMQKNEELQKQATEAQKKAAMQELANKFEANVKGVVDMVASAATEMDATSKSVTSVAESSKAKLHSLTGQIAGTSKNVQMVSSATTQLSSAINEISGQIARATTITSAAVEEAKQTDITVQGLSEASNKIGEVLEMINSIAAQINLLALNATIEAARAGEAGKGFAVVASEVKNLAAQTTKATEQIAAFISSIQGATGDTVTAINSISAKIRDINSISSTIAAAVEEQGAATRDIASNVQQAASGTEEVSRNASDVSAASDQTGAAAHEMNAATGELSRQAEILRREVDSFLVGIRG